MSLSDEPFNPGSYTLVTSLALSPLVPLFELLDYGLSARGSKQKEKNSTLAEQDISYLPFLPVS